MASPFHPTEEDRIVPQFCRDCRQKAPRAELSYGQGLCQACCRGYADQAALQEALREASPPPPPIHPQASTPTSRTPLWPVAQDRQHAHIRTDFIRYLEADVDCIEIMAVIDDSTCTVCEQWNGRVVSLTGATPDVPTILQAVGGGWPCGQCRCSSGAHFGSTSLPPSAPVQEPSTPDRVDALGKSLQSLGGNMLACGCVLALVLFALSFLGLRGCG